MIKIIASLLNYYIVKPFKVFFSNLATEQFFAFFEELIL